MSEIDLLRDFVAVYRYRSFRLAADHLGLAQSSVTKRIRQLESHLNMRLFNRTTRTVEPTDNARHLIAFAESTLSTAQAFQDEARMLVSGEMGSIRVGAIALAAETTITSSLSRLAETHPNLEVDVAVGSPDVYRDLATGECDVAIGDQANFETSAHAASLRMQVINQDHLVYAHRKGHPAANTSSLSKLLRYPIAIPSRYFNDNQLFSQLARLTESATTPRYRLNSLSACMLLVANSDAVTLAPRSLISGEMGGAFDLVTAKFDTGVDYTVVLATVARHEPTPAMRAFEQAVMMAG